MTRPVPDDEVTIQCYVCMKDHKRNNFEISAVVTRKEDAICMKCGKELFETDTYTSDSFGNLCYECDPMNNVLKETVNHPSHYNQGKIEVIDFIEDQGLGFHDGNAVKYICRHKHKGRPIEDIKKAIWYLNRLLSQLENNSY